MRKVLAEVWVECVHCEYLYLGSTIALQLEGKAASDSASPRLPEQPCPRCGGIENQLWSLPDHIYDWLMTVQSTVGSNDVDRARVGAVFVASACETMLANIVEFALRKKGVQPDLCLYLIRQSHGKQRLCDLYSVAVHKKLHAILESAKLAKWDEAWKRLAEARNTYEACAAGPL